MNEQHSHILVVDDDARLRDLLTRYLGEQGFEVKAVGDGKQMDKLRSREHFHLIVSAPSAPSSTLKSVGVPSVLTGVGPDGAGISASP